MVKKIYRRVWPLCGEDCHDQSLNAVSAFLRIFFEGGGAIYVEQVGSTALTSRPDIRPSCRRGERIRAPSQRSPPFAQALPNL